MRVDFVCKELIFRLSPLLILFGDTVQMLIQSLREFIQSYHIIIAKLVLSCNINMVNGALQCGYCQAILHCKALAKYLLILAHGSIYLTLRQAINLLLIAVDCHLVGFATHLEAYLLLCHSQFYSALVSNAMHLSTSRNNRLMRARDFALSAVFPPRLWVRRRR